MSNGLLDRFCLKSSVRWIITMDIKEAEEEEKPIGPIEDGSIHWQTYRH